MATRGYIEKALALARAHDFMLFLDECYSEIYTREAPLGGLEVAAATPERFKNLVVFNSLSKRSNLPGLRSGFCAGDATFLESLRRNPQHVRAASAGARAARLGRGLGGRGPRRDSPRGLPREIRHRREILGAASVTPGRPAGSACGWI